MLGVWRPYMPTSWCSGVLACSCVWHVCLFYVLRGHMSYMLWHRLSYFLYIWKVNSQKSLYKKNLFWFIEVSRNHFNNMVSIKPSQWTHLRWFAIDSMSKFDVESSSRFHWFWKANPHGNYDINSTWKLRRGLDFQNRQNIDQFSTWVFLCRINVELT